MNFKVNLTNEDIISILELKVREMKTQIEELQKMLEYAKENVGKQGK